MAVNASAVKYEQAVKEAVPVRQAGGHRTLLELGSSNRVRGEKRGSDDGSAASEGRMLLEAAGRPCD